MRFVLKPGIRTMRFVLKPELYQQQYRPMRVKWVRFRVRVRVRVKIRIRVRVGVWNRV